MSERWERIQTLFEEALALAPAERSSFLESACGAETELRDEVASLLAVHDRGGTAASLPAEWLSSLAGPRPPRFAAGQRVGGRYRIEALLGEGGMGEVYEAWDDDLSIRVALKTLHGIHDSRADLQRLKLEGLMARSVWHPNVCRVYDVSHDGTGKTTVWFLTMELLKGEPLSKILKETGRLPLDRALRLAEQMAAGLAAAHRAGVVHRDFKPSNVVLVSKDGDEQAMVTDFGTARRYEGEHCDRAVIGTPAYMAPEQVRGDEVGASADIYALGVVLFEMVTGTLPFGGESPIDIARRRLVEDPLPPRSIVPDLDGRWEQVILRALARDPAQRFSRVQGVVEALAGTTRIEESGTPAVGASPARHTLPTEHDPFVGRDREIEQLDANLAGRSRVVTLMGTGGMGKTRLAVHHGWRSLAQWPGGVWFCDLTEARDLNGITSVVASALGIQLGQGDPIEQIGRAIAGRDRCLLILDNFEQVVAHARATVARWRDQAANARFVVTSRERLDLDEECVQVIEPLTIEYGIELFIARARGLLPALDLNSAEAEAVKEIVRLVEGMPLAIELAGARMRVMSAVDIAGQMRKRFNLLAGGRSAHHETLRGTIDDSWELMHPWDRTAWAQCSVFEGGFTLEAAEAVLDLHRWPDLWVVDVLQSLVDKSLLRTSATGETTPQPRFGMYVSLQEYARMKLHHEDGLPGGDSGAVAEQATETRHARWYARFGTVDTFEALDHRGGVGRRAALQRELANLMAACRRAIARDDGAVAAALYRACHVVLSTRGPFQLAADLGAEVLRCPTVTGSDRAHALGNLGLDEMLSGRLGVAGPHFEAAMSMHREAGDREAECSLCRDLSTLCRNQGRLEEAWQHAERGLATVREIGARRAEGSLLDALGVLHRDAGHMDEALAHFEAALDIHREVGNRRHEGAVLNNLAILLYEMGRPDESRTHLEAALAIDREVGNRKSEATVLANLGNIHQEHGRLDEARHHYEASLTILREIGHRRLEGAVLADLGDVLRAMGRFDDAGRHLERAVEIHREVKNRRNEGRVMDYLADLHFDRNQLDEARSLLETALTIHREVGARQQEGVALGSLGRVLQRQGRLKAAREALTAGEAILREVKAVPDLAKLLCIRAELELQSENAADAQTILAEAESLAIQSGSGPHSDLGRRLAEVREMLETKPA